MEPQSTDTTAYWSSTVKLAAHDWDQLRTLGERIASLTEHPGWDALCHLVETKTAQLHAEVMPPAIRQHAEYIGLLSQQFGLGKVLEVPEAVRVLVQREEAVQRRAAQRAAGERTSR